MKTIWLAVYNFLADGTPDGGPFGTEFEPDSLSGTQSLSLALSRRLSVPRSPRTREPVRTAKLQLDLTTACERI